MYSLYIKYINYKRTTFFNTTLTNELATTSAQLLTADIEVASTLPLSSNAIKSLKTIVPNATMAKRQIFSTMATHSKHSKPTLIEVLAISNNYPLKGSCLARSEQGIILPISDILNSNKNGIVISNELKNSHNLTFNDTITIGDFSGPIIGIIESEPDINVQSLAIGPRVYTLINNSKKTGFDQTLSRVYHSTFLSFKNQQNITVIGKKLEQLFNVQSNDKTIQGSYGPSQPIVVRSYLDLSDNIVEGFENLNEFYLFLSLFTLILCGQDLVL